MRWFLPDRGAGAGREAVLAPLAGLRVAAVLDRFSQTCFEPEVTLLPLDARLWRMQLLVFRPELLFVESAWRGPRDSWRLRLARYPGRSDRTLETLVRACRRRGIPTVFWNKEDPVHFERFLDKARLFDFVFTSDEGKVEDYERALARRGAVRPLLFAAQPAIHHPIGASWRDRVCFAGSYGEPELAERRGQLEILLDAAAGFDLRIYDRQSQARSRTQAFPDRYGPYLREALDYRALTREYRRAKVHLNVNSVRDSLTMFSRRVFELIACGASVVSSPSAGIEQLFGDVVAVVSTVDEARAAIRRFLDDDQARRGAAARGIRQVMLRHTYADRIAEVCRAVGVTVPSPARPRFATLAIVHSDEEAHKLGDLLRRQELRPDEVAVLLCGASREAVAAALEGTPDLRVLEPAAGESEIAAARRAAARIRSPHVACVALQHELGPELFASQVACLRFARADVIGKAPGHAFHAFAPVHPHAVLVPRAILADRGWSSQPEELDQIEDAYRGLTQYATDDAGFFPT